MNPIPRKTSGITRNPKSWHHSGGTKPPTPPGLLRTPNPSRTNPPPRFPESVVSQPPNYKNLNSDEAAGLASEFVIKEYAESEDRLTQGECEKMTIPAQACSILVSALGYGSDATITDEKKSRLLEAGFAAAFI